MLKLVKYHIFPWSEYELSEQIISEQIVHRSTFGIVAAIYETVLKQSGKSIWGCKSTFMIEHITEVMNVYPNARFIFLVRDPRDVAVSARKSVFSPCHPYLSGQLWDTQQRLGLTKMSEYPTQFHIVQYEELLTNSSEVLNNLCSFLNIAWEDNLLNFFQRKEAQRSSKLSESWAKTGTAIQSNNFNKWKNSLSDKDIAWVESTCFQTMQTFGYTPQANVPPLEPSKKQLRAIQFLEVALRIKIEWTSFRKDSNVFLRWRRDVYTRWLKTWGRT